MKMYQILGLSLLGLCLIATFPKKHPLAAWKAAEAYLEIPAGAAYVNGQKQEVSHFFIPSHEVSNAQYQDFLAALKAEGKEDAYQKALPRFQKPASWKKAPLAEGAIIPQYYDHKGFADFPVLGISHEAAQAYCQWLTDKASIEIDNGYDIRFRLPTQAEWIRAARGETRHIYAWNTPYLQDGKGYFKCNFKRISAEKVTFNTETQSYEIVQPSTDDTAGAMTDKVKSYEANAFGLYQMCGNVAEMLDEEGITMGGSWNDTGYDVRVESVSEFTEASPYVGFRPVMIVQEK